MNMKIISTIIVSTFMLLSLIFVVLFIASDDFKNLITGYFEEESTASIVEQYDLDNGAKKAVVINNTEEVEEQARLQEEYEERVNAAGDLVDNQNNGGGNLSKKLPHLI